MPFPPEALPAEVILPELRNEGKAARGTDRWRNETNAPEATRADLAPIIFSQRGTAESAERREDQIDQ